MRWWYVRGASLVLLLSFAVLASEPLVQFAALCAPKPAEYVDPILRQALTDNGLTIGPEVEFKLGKTLPYRDTSVLKGSVYATEGFISVRGGATPIQELADQLSFGDPELKMRYEASLARAQRSRGGAAAIAEYLPSWMRNDLGKFFDCEGPNCFNTALRFGDRKQPVEHTSAHQMIRAVQKDYDQLKPGDSPKWGDLVLLWVPPSHSDVRTIDVASLDANESLTQLRLLHGATFLNYSHFLQKGSAQSDTPVGLEPARSALGLYERQLNPIVSFHRRKKSVAPAQAEPLRLVWPVGTFPRAEPILILPGSR